MEAYKRFEQESNVSDPSQSIAADDWLHRFSNLYNILVKKSFVNKMINLKKKNLSSISHLLTFSDFDIESEVSVRLVP